MGYARLWRTFVTQISSTRPSRREISIDSGIIATHDVDRARRLLGMWIARGRVSGETTRGRKAARSAIARHAGQRLLTVRGVGAARAGARAGDARRRVDVGIGVWRDLMR